MKNIYIFDTSVLISDPYFYQSFPNSEIIIPIAVINELDDLKQQFNSAGKHARICIRLLDNISNAGDISTGVFLENNTTLKVDVSSYDLRSDNFSGFGNAYYGDTQVLACLYANWKLSQDINPEQNVILVCNDINLRIKAKARGIQVLSHEKDNISFTDLYAGTRIIKDEKMALELQNKGFIDPINYNLELFPHECICIEGQEDNALCLARQITPNKLRVIKKNYPWGISARNKEQAFAIDLMMDPKIDLLTLIGKSGTGKSLMVLASALELVINKKAYERFVIYRPIQAVGKDIGYLPGLLKEKLEPWFQAIMDNFEILLTNKSTTDWRKELEMFQKKGRIEMEAITYIRGRSIPNAIMLIDECQNITKEDIKTILTRAGENTKVILTGDIEQIDNSELNALNNGLSYVIEKFKNSELAGHITFTQGERSRLATCAAEIL